MNGACRPPIERIDARWSRTGIARTYHRRGMRYARSAILTERRLRPSRRTTLPERTYDITLSTRNISAGTATHKPLFATNFRTHFACSLDQPSIRSFGIVPLPGAFVVLSTDIGRPSLRGLAMIWTTLSEWVTDLGRQYGVNPIIFGALYIGAIPFFSLSVAWIVRNIRRKRSVLLPALSAAFFFISSYLYLLAAGRGIPAWVYGVLGLMAAAGIHSTWKKVRKRTVPSARRGAVPTTCRS